ncbi:hypothetical protein [Exiguobacterium sp. AB2]|uniref:phage neck terminator protein n=1 Tax=Exiguobacterium sp. AB2 TaxID=1484479 RepID=UPI00068A9E52|nr:hypothetical protein [Exiguobacterium sp. AB2]
MIDYTAALTALTGHLKQGTGKVIVLENQSATQPAYPFCTYSVPSPYLPQRTDYIGDAMDEVVEFVVSLTWHSKSNIEAMTLAQQSVQLLKAIGGRQTLGDAGLTVVRIDGFTNRDTFLTIDTERRYGFDVRLRTHVSSTRPLDAIETVDINTIN